MLRTQRRGLAWLEFVCRVIWSMAEPRMHAALVFLLICEWRTAQIRILRLLKARNLAVALQTDVWRIER